MHIKLNSGSPSTDTVKLQVAVFPLVSIAVNITTVSLNGNWVPDLEDGPIETSGCVSLRSSHLQVISLGALKKGVFGA